MKTKAGIVATICLLVLVASNMAAIVGAENPIPIPGGEGYIEKFQGTTDKLGGGDYVGIRFMRKAAGALRFVEDAKFIVGWGTKNQITPNSIFILGEMTRYLGAAKVYDVHGGLVSSQYPIRVKTVWIQKLEDIFEFYDVDDDGTCDYGRDYDYWGLRYGDYLWHEPIYKKVSLRTAWTRSAINETLDESGRSGSWEFSLTATNLTYINITDIGPIGEPTGDGKLNELTFTFHLQAQLVNITNVIVPWFKVTVNATEHYKVVGVDEIQGVSFNGTKIDYTVKYDQEIVGWDFDSRNPNPRLLLEWNAIVGNRIPQGMAEWLKEQFLSRINSGTGDLAVETAEGNVTLSESNANSTDAKPSLRRRLKPRRLHLGDNWQRIGVLTWVTDVNVTLNEGDEPQTMNMTAQIQGHKRILVNLERGVSSGYIVLGGFSYPGGYRVYHDPSIGVASNLVNIAEIPGKVIPPLISPQLVVILIGTVTVIATVIFVARWRKRVINVVGVR